MTSERRRAHGEGTVYFDQVRGMWVGQASSGVNPVTGKRRRVKVRAKTKREAHRRLRDRIEELERIAGAVVPTTVGELVELWLAREAPKSMSPQTLAMVHSMVRNHLLPVLGAVPVGQLRAEHVEQLLDAKASQGLARSSLVKLHSFLGQAYDAGVRRRLVGWNPARVAVVPAARSRREGRALTPAEARALLNVADRERLGAWVAVAVTMGLRPGEVSGLTWDAVNIDERRMIVYQSLGWIQGKPQLKSPKTKRSRTLGIPARTLEAIRRHRTRQVGERLLAGPLWPSRWEELVFISQNGTPLDPSNIRSLVAAMAAEAGIAGRVTPYDLRHTATSVLSAAGVAPELLADLLGHVDTRMVFRHYRHPVTPTVDVAADNIDRALDA